jgi:hypothetical protein
MTSLPRPQSSNSSLPRSVTTSTGCENWPPHAPSLPNGDAAHNHLKGFDVEHTN